MSAETAPTENAVAPAASAETQGATQTMPAYDTKAAAPKKDAKKEKAPAKAAPKKEAAPKGAKTPPPPGAPRGKTSDKPHGNAGSTRAIKLDPKNTPTKAQKDAADVLKMLGDATRVAVVQALHASPRNVGELCAALGGQSQPAVSHHLALLRHSGIITPTRQGKNNVYDLTDKGRTLAKVIASVQESAA